MKQQSPTSALSGRKGLRPSSSIMKSFSPSKLLFTLIVVMYLFYLKSALLILKGNMYSGDLIALGVISSSFRGHDPHIGLEIFSPPKADEVPLMIPQPMFTCHGQASPSNSKLALVNNVRTATGTLWALVSNYASECSASAALIDRCQAVSTSSIQSDTFWQSSTTTYGEKPCRMHHFTPRKHEDGTDMSLNQIKEIADPLLHKDSTQRLYYRISSEFARNHVDIFAGHLPLGSVNMIGAQVQHFVFFRNAASKYVSAKLDLWQQSGNTLSQSMDDLIAHIQQEVIAALNENKNYESYKKYLLTPPQVEPAAQLSAAERSNLICNNLVYYNVLCGTVERMDESMQMLHYILDGDSSDSGLFQIFGMTTTLREAVEESKHQPDRSIDRGNEPMRIISARRNMNTPISTPQVLHRLQQDEDFYPKLLEYVKYEQQITDYAVALHNRQYKHMMLLSTETA